jgi:hypothetical protein
MHSLSGFIAVSLFLPITLFAQHHGNGSSGGSSNDGSSSGSSGSYSSPSPSSTPSYNPPPTSSSNSSRSDGGSRSSDSGSRGSSPSSSSGGGGYTAPSRSNSSEPSSRGSNTGSSSSPSPHSGSPNNSNGYSGNNSSNSVRDFRNGAQPSSKQFTVTDSSREPRSEAIRTNEQLTLRQALRPNRNPGEASLGHNPQSPSVGVDPKILSKYAPRESKLLEKQSRLDQEANKLFVKYKLAGRDAEYAHKQAKLDEKRNKLLNKELKLTRSYERVILKRPKPCKVDPCPVVCPPGTTARKQGCAPPKPNPLPTSDCYDRTYISIDDRCFDRSEESYLSTSPSFNSTNSGCNGYFTQLMNQKKILESLADSARSACVVSLTSMECTSFTDQLNAAEAKYRLLEQQYAACQTSNGNNSVKGRHP